MAVIPAPAAPTHDLGGARFTSLATPSRGSTDSSVWRVEIDPDTPATPHRLTREEVVVLSGRAQVRIDGRSAVADTGDVIVVPADVPFGSPRAGPSACGRCASFRRGQAMLDDGEPFTPPWAE